MLSSKDTEECLVIDLVPGALIPVIFPYKS